MRRRDEIRDRLVELLDARPTPDLAELALLVSAHSRPGEVDVESELASFDDMARRLPADPDVEDVLELLFEELGFEGDVDDYYSAENSHLDLVVRRRRGIPLTLSVVACAVGVRAGVGLVPIGLPGHVIVGTGDGEQFVDVFDQGRSLSRDDCARIIATLHPGVELSASMLEPMSPRAVVVRMLNNLIGVHQRRGQRADLLAALELRDVIHRTPTAGARDIAAALAADGRLAEAADQLERAADGLDDADAAEKLRAQATRYLAKLN